jgi:hypothetical protein
LHCPARNYRLTAGPSPPTAAGEAAGAKGTALAAGERRGCDQAGKQASYLYQKPPPFSILKIKKTPKT